MAHREDWRDELRDAKRREGWAVAGPTRIVKVLPLGRPVARTLKGFVCLEKTLLGKTPAAIEAMLGLPPGALRDGCRVFRFKRLPLQQEVEYELTAKHPGGLVFNPAMHDASYPPGSTSVHQWRLLADIPVEHLLDLAPGARYPYLHG